MGKFKIHQPIESVLEDSKLLNLQTKLWFVVDYAHTPDALKNVLTTINKIRTQNENLITWWVVEVTEIKKKDL